MFLKIFIASFVIVSLMFVVCAGFMLLSRFLFGTVWFGGIAFIPLYAEVMRPNIINLALKFI